MNYHQIKHYCSLVSEVITQQEMDSINGCLNEYAIGFFTTIDGVEYEIEVDLSGRLTSISSEENDWDAHYVYEKVYPQPTEKERDIITHWGDYDWKLFKPSADRLIARKLKAIDNLKEYIGRVTGENN